MKIIIRFVQFIIVITPLVLFIYLVDQYFVPSGEFEIRHSVEKSSPYIDALAPPDRVEQPQKEDSGWTQAIIADPVFFFLHPHRAFAKLTFEIWFQNKIVPIIEFGGRVRTNPEGYELKPLHNLLIDNLNWSRITNNSLMLLQKTKQYKSWDEFVANPPKRDQIAVYKADYPVPLRLSDYQRSFDKQTITASLRGGHELKTYIKDETLFFDFEYMDMNRDEGADPVVAIVFDEQGRPVADARMQDDGDIKRDAVPSQMQKLSLNVTGLSEGVYKIVLNASRDIFFRKIHTTQNKLVFLNMIYIGDEVGYRESTDTVLVWTISERFQMQTRHAEGVQNVVIGGEKESVAQPYEMYTFLSKPELKEVEIPKGDIEIFADRPIAFSKSQYFTPDPVAIKSYMQIEDSAIEYILTSYLPPRNEGDWLVQNFEFNTASLVLEKDSWKFTFSTPLIEELRGRVIVKEINMKWRK